MRRPWRLGPSATRYHMSLPLGAPTPSQKEVLCHVAQRHDSLHPPALPVDDDQPPHAGHAEPLYNGAQRVVLRAQVQALLAARRQRVQLLQRAEGGAGLCC